jgi:hypothetical protein
VCQRLERAHPPKLAVLDATGGAVSASEAPSSALGPSDHPASTAYPDFVSPSFGKVARFQVQKKPLCRNTQHTVTAETILTAVDQVAPGLRIILSEVSERGQVAGVDAFCVLDLDGVKAAFSIDDEVHLDPRPGLLIKERVFGLRVVTPGAQMLANQPFERRTIQFTR